jgi:cell division protein FtsL
MEFTIIPPTEGAAHQGLGRRDLTITEVGRLVEEDSAVAEASRVGQVATLAITMAVSLTHMIKGRLKAIWASTIITTLARKIPSTKTAVVIMVVECPPLSSMPKPSQMVIPRAMVIMKTVPTATMTKVDLVCDLRGELCVENGMTKSTIQ